MILYQSQQSNLVYFIIFSFSFRQFSRIQSNYMDLIYHYFLLQFSFILRKCFNTQLQISLILQAQFKNTPNMDAKIQQMRTQLRKTDPYDILQVKPSDDQNTIKQSFKKMALKYHPDKNSMPGAKQAFFCITNAYDMINKNKSHSLPPKPSFHRPMYTKKPSEQKTSYDNFKEPQQQKRTQTPSFSSQFNSNNQQNKKFQEQMFDIFKDITTKLQKQVKRRKEYRQEQSRAKNAYRNTRTVFQNNRNRRYQPHPVVMVLLVVFLFLFFLKSSSRVPRNSNSSMSFMPRRMGGVISMGMGRIGRSLLPTRRSNNIYSKTKLNPDGLTLDQQMISKSGNVISVQPTLVVTSDQKGFMSQKASKKRQKEKNQPKYKSAQAIPNSQKKKAKRG